MGKEFNFDEFTTPRKKQNNSFKKYKDYIDDALDAETTQLYKRINMAFSDDIYNFILSEADKLGYTITLYVNDVISQTDPADINKYINDFNIKYSKNHIPKRRGVYKKRINIKFAIDNYEIIAAGATEHSMTITQYVNVIFSKKIHDTSTGTS